jgi:hypothetical protein
MLHLRDRRVICVELFLADAFGHPRFQRVHLRLKLHDQLGSAVALDSFAGPSWSRLRLWLWLWLWLWF